MDNEEKQQSWVIPLSTLVNRPEFTGKFFAINPLIYTSKIRHKNIGEEIDEDWQIVK
jgi:hypothetical protein